MHRPAAAGVGDVDGDVVHLAAGLLDGRDRAADLAGGEDRAGGPAERCRRRRAALGGGRVEQHALQRGVVERARTDRRLVVERRSPEQDEPGLRGAGELDHRRRGDAAPATGDQDHVVRADGHRAALDGRTVVLCNVTRAAVAPEPDLELGSRRGAARRRSRRAIASGRRPPRSMSIALTRVAGHSIAAVRANAVTPAVQARTSSTPSQPNEPPRSVHVTNTRDSRPGRARRAERCGVDRDCLVDVGDVAQATEEDRAGVPAGGGGIDDLGGDAGDAQDVDERLRDAATVVGHGEPAHPRLDRRRSRAGVSTASVTRRPNAACR